MHNLLRTFRAPCAVCALGARSTLLLVEPTCRMLSQKIIKLNWLCINLLLLPGKSNFTCKPQAKYGPNQDNIPDKVKFHSMFGTDLDDV